MMKQLKKDVQAVVRDLKILAQKTEKIVKKLETLEKTQASKAPRPKTKKKPLVKKAKGKSPADTVLTIFKRRKKGIDVKTLKKMTGLKDSSLRGVIFRLREKGVIKSEGNGLYVKI